MNTKLMMMTIACAAALGGSLRAQANDVQEEERSAGWNGAMGEGLSYNETPVVSAEVSLAFDSKYLSYGLVDNKDPILTPAASVTLFDWLYLGVEAVFDTTTYGRKAGYSKDGGGRSRGAQYTELDPSVGFAHSFSPEDCAWLPTTVEFDLGYMYEYHPRSFNYSSDDTQFLSLEVSLPDLWLEPTFLYERDIDRDDGTYLNLELGHTFAVVGDDEDPVLTLRPSVAQGFGNRQRMKGYLPNLNSWDDEEADYTEPLAHAGLMDTLVKLEAEWTISSVLTLSGYVGYSDFIFDRKIRESARAYESSGDWDDSWNVIAGLSVAVAF